jgi:hypothetical protein
MKRDKNMLKHEIVRKYFREGKEVKVRIPCIVIVNKKIISCPVFLDDSEAISDNAIPHITLQTG